MIQHQLMYHIHNMQGCAIPQPCHELIDTRNENLCLQIVDVLDQCVIQNEHGCYNTN